MLDKIIDGICKKLRETFGEQVKIYTEPVKQGLSEPCFFIQLVNPSSVQLLGRRYLRENLFCIQYFPENTDETNAECLAVLDELYSALEYIGFDGGLQRGIKMRGEISEGVLNFFVNYNFIAVKGYDPPAMEKAQEINVRIKD
jgi:hypothetical protein